MLGVWTKWGDDNVAPPQYGEVIAILSPYSGSEAIIGKWAGGYVMNLQGSFTPYWGLLWTTLPDLPEGVHL